MRRLSARVDNFVITVRKKGIIGKHSTLQNHGTELVGSIFGEWGFKFVKIKGLGPIEVQ